MLVLASGANSYLNTQKHFNSTNQTYLLDDMGQIFTSLVHTDSYNLSLVVIIYAIQLMAAM